MLKDLNLKHVSFISHKPTRHRIPHRKTRAVVLRRTREMKNNLLEQLCSCEDSNSERNTKASCQELEAVHGGSDNGTAALCTTDGTSLITLITESKLILGEGAEHIQSFWNRPPNIAENVIEQVSQRPPMLHLPDSPKLEEALKAIQCL